MIFRCILAICICTFAAVAPGPASEHRTVALSFETTPLNVSGLSLPVINDLGQVAYLGGGRLTVNQPSSHHTGNRAWSEATGASSLVAGVGDILPNAPNGMAVSVFNQFGFNNEGKMALRVGYPLASTPFATYIQSSNGLAYITKTGDSAPGLPNHKFGALTSLILNNTSQVVVHGDVDLSASEHYDSIWRQEIGAMGLIKKTSTSFEGDLREPVLNDSGTVAFRGSNQTVWIGQPGNVHSFAQAGDSAPGQNGALFSTFADPVINSAGA